LILQPPTVMLSRADECPLLAAGSTGRRSLGIDWHLVL
jgi:hypothetical protein